MMTFKEACVILMGAVGITLAFVPMVIFLVLWIGVLVELINRLMIVWLLLYLMVSIVLGLRIIKWVVRKLEC